MTRIHTLNLFLIAVVSALFPYTVCAQTRTKAGTIEASLYGGGTFDLPGAAGSVGITDFANPANGALQYNPGKKSMPFIGSGLALSLARALWVYGDYSYMFPDRSTVSVTRGNSTGVATTSRHYWSGSGGFQLSFPTVQRVVPYLEIGLGVVHQNYNNSSAYTNVVISTTPTIRTGNTFAPRIVVNSILTPHIGGGVRIFVKERGGFKFSVDGYEGGTAIEQQVPGATPNSFPRVTRRGWGRLTAGYFVRFGRR